MNHSQYPIDDELVLLEKELKSLTPASFTLANPQPSQLSALNPATMEQSVAFPLPGEPAWTNPSVNRTWLRTVAISWSTGLAAGLLISMFWTQWTSNEIANKGPQSPVNGQLSEPNLTAIPSLESPTDSRSNDSVPPQERNRPRYESMGNSSYLTAFDSSDQSILRPFVPLRSGDWDAAVVGTKTRQRGTSSRSLENPKSNDASSSSSALNAIPIPFERPRTQGQHQWLKSLMKSEEFGSVSKT